MILWTMYETPLAPCSCGHLRGCFDIKWLVLTLDCPCVVKLVALSLNWLYFEEQI